MTCRFNNRINSICVHSCCIQRTSKFFYFITDHLMYEVTKFSGNFLLL
uniref:Uncharacterized protein n=1 Tax=Ascaris lumbricoides TaxID=6252 RepID=A0A0M3IWH6_ASCLU